MQGKPDFNAGERQAFGLLLPGPSHPDLRRLKKQHRPSRHGHKIWNATWILLDYLRRQEPPRGVRVLDVGCGWGLAGIFCARFFRARVTAIDVDPQVFPFLELHARLNQVEIRTGQASFDEIPLELLKRHDQLIGADICFDDGMIDPLCRLVERAVRARIDRIVLADPGRPSFRRLVSRCARQLGGVEQAWTTEEPLLSWPAGRPKIRGRLLLVPSSA